MKNIIIKQSIIIITILIFNLVFFSSSVNAKDSFESINDFLKARRGN